MVRRHSFILSALLTGLLLFVARSVAAQIGTGVLTGKVVDASSGQPLADVVVTATSPALQGDQTVVTDGSGNFRIPSLPPGEYTVLYEGDGFRPFDRTRVPLGSGATLRVDAQLLPEELAAKEVTVVAAPPTGDLGSARSGVTIGTEFRNRIPLAPPARKGGGARSFEQLAEVAPTARNDLYGASISGTTSVENLYFIDGLSSSDPSYGYNASPLSIDFIKETNVITGGYLPEYGRGGGGVLDVVTQSGSNEFRGSVFGFVSPWQAKPKFPQAQDAITTTTQQDSIRDIGFSLGGPIIKDKLWFFVGGLLSRQSFNINRSLNSLSVDAMGDYVRDDDGLIVSEPIAGAGRKFLAEQTGYQYLGKLTWSPTQNDRIELTHRGTPTRSGGDGTYSVDYETGQPNLWGNPGGNLIGPYSSTAWRQVFDSYNTGLKWTRSALNKRLTFDTLVGWHNQRSADLASDGSRIGGGGLSGTPMFVYARTSPAPHSLTEFESIPDPSVCINPVPGGDARCPVSQYAFGGPQILQDNLANRVQAREIVTFVTPGLGHHIIKAGAEVEFSNISVKRSYPGGVSLNESAGGANVNDFRRLGGMVAPDDAYTIALLRYKISTVSVGAFLQDSWSIMDKVTLNAGFRYDTQTLYAEQGRGLVQPNQWSPRVGLIFDPTQKGYGKLFVNYAIYYQSLPLNVMARAGSGEPQVRTGRRFGLCNPNAAGYPESCDRPENLNVATLNGSSDPNQNWAYQSTGRLAVDPDLKPQSTNELTAGAEYEIIRNGRLSVTYIRRWMRSIVEDMSRDEGATFFLGNPGSGIASDFPEAERTFDAGILAFTKTFSDRWLAQASYTLSQLKGNWEGLFRAQTGQLDPGTNSDFDLRDLTVNRKGFLAGDRRHEFKFFGAYDIPLARHHHVNIGASYRTRSGAPTTPLGRHVLYGNGEVFLLPRGSGERMPWVHNVDLNVSYTFMKTEKQTLAFTADVFNLFNLRAVIRRGTTYTLRAVQPIQGEAAKNPYVDGDRRNIDPGLIQAADEEAAMRPFEPSDKSRTFGAPLEYQAPITLRVGVKSTF